MIPSPRQLTGKEQTQTRTCKPGPEGTTQAAEAQRVQHRQQWPRGYNTGSRGPEGTTGSRGPEGTTQAAEAQR
eukprot:355051-Chlamydomonas_euryale.AAC.5